MRKRIYKILITGGAGFIGSAFARLLVKKGRQPVVIDKLTYAGDLARLQEVRGKYKFYKADICDRTKIEPLFKKEKPDIVVNFAASTHVDRSIIDATPFTRTNVIGTQVLLDVSKKYGIKKFLQISTDEVCGEIKKGKFTEDSPLLPNSPYAASKAAADLLIRSYIKTYDFPAVIVRPCNNYGPWQYPEKFIPHSILRVLKGGKIPVYGSGRNVREWLYVEDCAEGILRILSRGKNGEIYNLGSRQEMKNITVAEMILKILVADKNLIEFVRDRPGHDIRYSLDSGKLLRQTQWRHRYNFEEGLKNTVRWCVRNKAWLLSKWKDVSLLYQ